MRGNKVYPGFLQSNATYLISVAEETSIATNMGVGIVSLLEGYSRSVVDIAAG